MSQGGAFVHNIFAGRFRLNPERNRYTPYHLPHRTDVAGLSIILNGDNRFFNNLFVPAFDSGDKQAYGLAVYEKTGYPNFVDGNAYYGHALPFAQEKHAIRQNGFDPVFRIEETNSGIFLSFRLEGLNDLQTETVSTARLEKAKLPKQQYETPDGEPILFDRNYDNTPRNTDHPQPGAFGNLKNGDNYLTVWTWKTK
jgi:hypothetical protein